MRCALLARSENTRREHARFFYGRRVTRVPIPLSFIFIHGGVLRLGTGRDSNLFLCALDFLGMEIRGGRFGEMPSNLALHPPLCWARKYGILVNFDLHTAPGSQMGLACAWRARTRGEERKDKAEWMGALPVGSFTQRLSATRAVILQDIAALSRGCSLFSGSRSLVALLSSPSSLSFLSVPFTHTSPGYKGIRVIVEFISQPEYTDLIPMFGIVNEDVSYLPGIGHSRAPGPPLASTSLEYIVLDTYPHFVYDGAANDSPIAMSTDALEGGRDMAEAGVQLLSVVVESKACPTMNASEWNDTTKPAVKQFTLTSMDAMLVLLDNIAQYPADGGRRADRPRTGRCHTLTPVVGRQSGSMPTDPRGFVGVCERLFDGVFNAWQTGGAGAGIIAPTTVQSLEQWPPATLSNVDVSTTLLPTYTASLAFVTPAATTTPTACMGSGWFDAADTVSMVTPVAGCIYPIHVA
ncbi:hypothetical protein B0H16DRAFT_1701303 [Mycena metata]|uniref:Uncharacterized protein n=1 Tax=Mycena metata TaxID=1033252 RepID=A0AAD7HBM7_9AGAR|nr:hypothetical protein B0H16DRAFT_1701303 [Mycena metata]